MKPIILFRDQELNDPELEVAKKYFKCVHLRTECRDNLVIGRYSVLPNYVEMLLDLDNMGSKLINNYQQHSYIANFKQYYEDLYEVTPQTWFRADEVPQDSGPWILKGRTNSRKQQFWEKMYAGSWKQLMEVHRELSNDPFIGQQEIIIRKYVELMPVEEAVAGADFKNEWRFFYFRGTKLAHGFYWVQSEKKGEINQAGMDFAQMVADRIGNSAPFVVIDIGQLKDGSWTLIELNDGQMAGLSHCDPDELYRNLKIAMSF